MVIFILGDQAPLSSDGKNLSGHGLVLNNPAQIRPDYDQGTGSFSNPVYNSITPSGYLTVRRVGKSQSILRSTIGLREAHQPIGSFLFLGSTGVGKTLLAKSLSKHYFGSEKNILRLDMSEYSEKVSSSKLVGASPGYVGYEEGGVLIERLKKTPHCVILFDEIEKAHPSVQQLLLQILEEGEIEDNSGTKAYFKDSIVILTSNIGASLTRRQQQSPSKRETTPTKALIHHTGEVNRLPLPSQNLLNR